MSNELLGRGRLWKRDDPAQGQPHSGPCRDSTLAVGRLHGSLATFLAQQLLCLSAKQL